MKIPTVFDLCTPRREVLGGRVAEADFAADLAAVLSGKAPADYLEPAQFFENSHPTRGLKRLLEHVCRRLSGAGGEAAAIFRLDTSFGGGKTHGLIALTHAARHPEAVPDEFLDPALRPGGSVRLAAFDGENAEPAGGRRMAEGVFAKTPWGEIAFRLAGRSGFDRVRASDEQGVAPGAETIRDLFGGEPALILLDELAVYLRKVKGRTAQRDAAGQLTAFLSVLFKAVETAPNAAVVFTLALGKEGAVDAYREENQWLADRMAELGSVAARKATLLNPTEEDETAPVLRRRLFERIEESRVDEAVAAYRAVWRAHGKEGELSRDARQPETLDRFRAGYPFHPELLDTLTRKVSTLTDFQRVRGMLRLLTRTVAHLWKERPADAAAIHLHHLPVGSSAIRSELITRLGQTALEPALNADVGSKRGKSLAEEIDDELHGGLPPYGAYAARTIFLHTLAFNEPLRGCSARRLRYSMVGPGTDFAYIEETRKRFLQDSAYLDDRPGAPLRFLAEANLNKIIRTREGMVDPGDARAEIHDRIRSIFGSGRGGKPELEVIPFPGGPSDIPDDASDRPRLVVLSPDAVGIASDSDPVPALLRRLHERKGADDKELRLRRNHLAFLAAEAGRKENLRQRAVRRLALAELKKPVHSDDLADHQQKMVGELEKKSQTDLALAVQQCYRRLFVPRAAAAGGSLEPLPLDDYDASEKPGNGQRAVVRALREKGKLRLPEDQPDAPEYVRDKTPLKTKGEMTTEALRDEFRQNPALPMLIGDQVFIRGVRLGVEQGRFVYRRGDLLFGPEDPPGAEIVVDGESTVCTVQYAKNIGIWPRPAPKPDQNDHEDDDGTDDRKTDRRRTGDRGTGGEGKFPKPDDDTPSPEPGVWSGSAEGPMGEALARVREQAQQAGVSLGSLTVRPQEWGDALRLLRAVGTAPLGAETAVELAGGYETRDGSSYCMQEFRGTVADAAPVVDFLEPQCRDASSVDLKIHLRLTFPGGLPPTGEGWEKLAGKLPRWVIGAAVLSAEAKPAAANPGES